MRFNVRRIFFPTFRELIDTGKHLIPIEIKSGETISDYFFEGLRYIMALGPRISQTGVLIHGGNDLYKRENFLVLPWFQFISE
jgi:hypothetical protein